jgi:hypothetical protein
MGIERPGGRAFNHPTENLPEVKLCNVCSMPLPGRSVEYLIGVHTWCVAAVAQRPTLRKGPAYGKTPDEDE